MDFIEVYPNAISNDLCDRLIAAFETHPRNVAPEVIVEYEK